MEKTRFNQIIYRKTTNWNFEERDFTANMLLTLAKIDGKKMISEIADELEIDLAEIEIAISELCALSLIEVESQIVMPMEAFKADPANLMV